MAALFDTGALERFRRRQREAEDLAVRFHPPIICLHVAAEYLYGMVWSQMTPKSEAEGREFIASFEMLQPTMATAAIYARLRTDCRRTGLVLPDPDLWIAAHAIEECLPLVSTDHHFTAFSELNLHLIP